MGTAPVEAFSPKMYCSECGRPFPAAEMVKFGDVSVCADCKPRYVQRMREGGVPLSGVRYGGFWIRAVAVFIDGLIVGAVLVPIFLLLGAGSQFASLATPGADPTSALMTMGMLELAAFALVFVYQVYFVSQRGATPGKMVLGLKVVTTTGERPSVGRAIGRYFAYLLSGFTLYIGYLIAAFDSEKRALHDHICNTRVIRQS